MCFDLFQHAEPADRTPPLVRADIDHRIFPEPQEFEGKGLVFRHASEQNVVLMFATLSTVNILTKSCIKSRPDDYCAQRSLRSSEQKYHLVQKCLSVSLCVCLLEKSDKSHALKVN